MKNRESSQTRLSTSAPARNPKKHPAEPLVETPVGNPEGEAGSADSQLEVTGSADAAPLSEDTIGVLKNFAEIRTSGIMLRDDGRLYLRSTSKAIYADAQITERFPRSAPIFRFDVLVQELGFLRKPVLV